MTYINDFVQVIVGTSVKIRQYPDDCALYSSITSTHDQLELNKVIARFCKWSRTSQMSLNFKKTVLLTFSNTKQPLQFAYFNEAHKLAFFHAFKYLGGTFSPELKSHAHIKCITNKALRNLGYLKRNC